MFISSSTVSYENFCQVKIDNGKPKFVGELNLPAPLLDAFHHVLQTPCPDLLFKASLLSLPSEDVVSQEMTPCDPVVLRFALNIIRAKLGHHLRAEFQRIFDDMTEEISKVPEYKYTPLDAGRRKLRNMALSYLTASTDEVADLHKVRMAFNHFIKADNMTDRMEGNNIRTNC